MSGHSRVCYHGVPRIIEESYIEPVFSPKMERIAEAIDNQTDHDNRKNGFK